MSPLIGGLVGISVGTVLLILVNVIVARLLYPPEPRRRERSPSPPEGGSYWPVSPFEAIPEDPCRTSGP